MKKKKKNKKETTQMLHLYYFCIPYNSFKKKQIQIFRQHDDTRMDLVL